MDCSIYYKKISVRWWVVLLAAIFPLLFTVPVPATETAAVGGAERPAGVVRLVSSRPGGRIGDAIPFTLEIHLEDGCVLDDGSLAGLEIRPESLPPELYACTLTPFDRQQAVRKQGIEIRGSLRVYAPGNYRVGPTRLVCRLRDDDHKTKLVDLPTTALMVKVAGLQPGISTSKISLVIPEAPPPLSPPSATPGRVAAASYFGILSLLLALFCVIGVYLELRRARTRTPEPSRKKEPVSPAARLDHLLADQKSGNDWHRLVEIDHELRRLLCRKLSLPARLAGGCGRSFATRIIPWLEPLLNPEKGRELIEIYTEIDALIIREESRDKTKVAGIKERLKIWLADLIAARPEKEGERDGV